MDFWYRVGGIQVRIPVARLLRASGQPLSGVGVTPDSVDRTYTAPRALAGKDAACSNVTSTAAVSEDPLVQTAARWLLASPR